MTPSQIERAKQLARNWKPVDFKDGFSWLVFNPTGKWVQIPEWVSGTSPTIKNITLDIAWSDELAVVKGPGCAGGTRCTTLFAQCSELFTVSVPRWSEPSGQLAIKNAKQYLQLCGGTSPTNEADVADGGGPVIEEITDDVPVEPSASSLSSIALVEEAPVLRTGDVIVPWRRLPHAIGDFFVYPLPAFLFEDNV